MKKFNIPEYYRSPIISKVKAKRKIEDPRKKDFRPTILPIGNIDFIISRHFGFCYGVENAIEKSYTAIEENPGKRIFLISQMIHNPDVNEDLENQGIHFIQDTNGKQLIPWDEINADDILIIPAFGTTVEIENIIKKKKLITKTYNTTCPFVEKVWNRSAKLGEDNFTIIIHGKHKHEETRATFSHSKENAPSIIVKDLNEAKILGEFMLGNLPIEQFHQTFRDKISIGLNPLKDFEKIGVVNQTTMLASETQEIADYFKNVMKKKYGEENLKQHYANTRDTLCYATNDNQQATIELLNYDADLAIIVGGYNSSNTTHLVELLEQKFNCFFIRNEKEIISKEKVRSFDIHQKKVIEQEFLPNKEKLKIIITSGASCPDSVVDKVIRKILFLTGVQINNETILL